MAVLLPALENGPKVEASTQSAPTEIANVLVIHSYSLELPWSRQQRAGIDQGFQESGHNVKVYHEFLDSKRYPDLSYRQEFLDYIRSKYRDTPLQVLMVSDDPGLNMILEVRDEYFPALPVVFMGVNHVQQVLLDTPWITGVFETRSDVEIFLEAKRQTGADTMILISDSSETGQAALQRIEANTLGVDDLPKIMVLKDIPDTQVDEKLGAYPDHWPIFMSGQLREGDAQGPLIGFARETQILSSQLPNPLYTNTVMRLGHGAVGGKLLAGGYHGQQAVQLAIAILDGTPVSEIAPILEAESQWMFDATELERANIDLKALPPDSVLINLKPSFYEQYRQLVWFAIIIFCLGSITIVVLADAIRRQKRAEKQLKENERKLEQRVSERTSELSAALNRLKHTQAQLIQTEKLSSLGQFVGGIAHEFNNPLNFISGNIEHLQDYIEELSQLILHYRLRVANPGIAEDYGQEVDLEYIQEDIPRILHSIRHGAERIHDIVCTLQEFSRNDQQGIKSTDLNQSLDSTLLILNTRLSKGIEVIKDYDTLPRVDCNPGEVNQVFMSVLLNAVEVLESSDSVNRQIAIRTIQISDSHVRITIQDTGSGIPKNILDKVFDPFFTTKPVGQGTGLGLALSYQTIQQHQGSLSLQSEVGKGTTVVIELPIESSQNYRSEEVATMIEV
ncbi:MAG: ATP-binding protein [Leptolyngbyaceae cyanobacterium]